MDTGAFVCLDTGKVHWQSDYVDEDDPLPDDLDTSDRYVQVPDKQELDLGRELVLAFIDDANPGDYDDVVRFFRRRGAYGPRRTAFR